MKPGSGKKTSEAEKKPPEAEKNIKRRKKSFMISANFRVISMIGKKAVLYTSAALHSAGLKTTNCESKILILKRNFSMKTQSQFQNGSPSIILLWPTLLLTDYSQRLVL